MGTALASPPAPARRVYSLGDRGESMTAAEQQILDEQVQGKRGKRARQVAEAYASQYRSK